MKTLQEKLAESLNMNRGFEKLNEAYQRSDYEEIRNKIKSGAIAIDVIEKEREIIKKEREKLKPVSGKTDIFNNPISVGDIVLENGTDLVWRVMGQVGNSIATSDWNSFKSKFNFLKPTSLVVLVHEGKPVDFTNQILDTVQDWFQ